MIKFKRFTQAFPKPDRDIVLYINDAGSMTFVSAVYSVEEQAFAIMTQNLDDLVWYDTLTEDQIQELVDGGDWNGADVMWAYTTDVMEYIEID